MEEVQIPPSTRTVTTNATTQHTTTLSTAKNGALRQISSPRITNKTRKNSSVPSTKTNKIPIQVRITIASTKHSPRRLKMTKDTFTIGTWNVQTLWAADKLELLGNEMKEYRYAIISISNVHYTGKGETSNSDFIWLEENNTHTLIKGFGILLGIRAKKSLLGYYSIN